MFYGFYALHESTTGRDLRLKPEIMVSLLHDGGGSINTFHIKWDVVDSVKPRPYIQAASEQWESLAAMPHVIRELAAIGRDDPSPEEVMQLLLRLGFRDVTNRATGSQR